MLVSSGIVLNGLDVSEVTEWHKKVMKHALIRLMDYVTSVDQFTQFNVTEFSATQSNTTRALASSSSSTSSAAVDFTVSVVLEDTDSDDSGDVASSISSDLSAAVSEGNVSTALATSASALSSGDDDSIDVGVWMNVSEDVSASLEAIADTQVETTTAITRPIPSQSPTLEPTASTPSLTDPFFNARLVVIVIAAVLAAVTMLIFWVCWSRKSTKINPYQSQDEDLKKGKGAKIAPHQVEDEGDDISDMDDDDNIEDPLPRLPSLTVDHTDDNFMDAWASGDHHQQRAPLPKLQPISVIMQQARLGSLEQSPAAQRAPLRSINESTGTTPAKPTTMPTPQTAPTPQPLGSASTSWEQHATSTALPSISRGSSSKHQATE